MAIARLSRFLKLPPDKVRLIYVDGRLLRHERQRGRRGRRRDHSREIGGPYACNGREDDELAWDQSPPQLIIRRGIARREGRATRLAHGPVDSPDHEGMPDIPPSVRPTPVSTM